jgi:DNA-binding beta-propeller fold protein YncE
MTDVSAQKRFQDERLITIWETKKDLKTPESLVYDVDNDVLYVANINQNPWEKDGNGYISKMNLKGDIVEGQWIKGLSAPKGMGIHKGKLYVTDINELVEIDIKAETIIKKYPIEGAKKLNDIAVDKNGTVYFSDMGDNAIYTLKKGKIELFLKKEDLKNINGLCCVGKILMAGLSDRVVSIDINTRVIKPFVNNTVGVDGIVSTGRGTFLISDWEGRVFEIKEGIKPQLLLDTTPLKINAADIEYIKGKDILLVPTFFKDNIIAYQITIKK